ncbi:MAG TPA: hypothetical protein VK179_09295 [Bacteroidales bacterium]|nr:hypothetical protein [Bacteroidales bacterium]
MKFLFSMVIPVLLVCISSCRNESGLNRLANDTILVSDTIQYHTVRINKDDGSILPWFSADKGASYDTVLMLVWNFWKNMETDSNGLKYYMNHQVWKPEHDSRGLGGDQVNMALSSWALLYAYTGDTSVKENLKYIADTYLARSLSSETDAWPSIPYPYNTVIHSGVYDGDMRNGKFITQPDKAGSFGYELISLYKVTGDSKYLEAAKRIAETLMKKMNPGDSLRSPLPFRVNARTGETGSLMDNGGSGKKVQPALYTANWTGTIMMYEELMKLDPAKKVYYENSFNLLLNWMKSWPLKTNKWGPFFEDIPGWSNTQTNAITFAMFILQHRQLFPQWQSDVKGIIDWTYKELGNHEYEKYGVVVMNEQTVYRVPGNSHSSRQASVELLYAKLSGDTSYTQNAIRTLNWATYTVADDGRNRYIRDDIWLTDGYGDYVRHYLRAMAARPDLAPALKNRLLATTSVISFIIYSPGEIKYKTFDMASSEMLRLINKPHHISVNGLVVNESDSTSGYLWTPLPQGGGVLQINKKGNEVVISLNSPYD